MIVRRERPHPGAQLDAFEEHDGWRYTAFATDTPPGSSPISKPDTARTPGSRTGRTAKDTGLDHFPSRRD